MGRHILGKAWARAGVTTAVICFGFRLGPRQRVLGKRKGGNEGDDDDREAKDKKAHTRIEIGGEIAGHQPGNGNAAITGKLVEAGGHDRRG